MEGKLGLRSSHIISVLILLCMSGQLDELPEEQFNVMEYIHHGFKHTHMLNCFRSQKFEIPTNANEQFPPEDVVKPPPQYLSNNQEGDWESRVGRPTVRRIKSNGEFGHGKTSKKCRTTPSASSITEDPVMDCHQTDSIMEEVLAEHPISCQSIFSATRNSPEIESIFEELSKGVVGPEPKNKARKKMNSDPHSWEKPKTTLKSGSYIIGEDPAIKCGFNPQQVYDRKSKPKSTKANLQEAIRLIMAYAISKDGFIETYRDLSRFADEYPGSSLAIINAVKRKDSAVSSFIPPPRKGALYNYLCRKEKVPSEVCLEFDNFENVHIINHPDLDIYSL